MTRAARGLAALVPVAAAFGRARAQPAEDCAAARAEVDLRPEKDGLALALTVSAPESTGWSVGTPFAWSGADLEFSAEFQTADSLAGDTVLTAKSWLDPGATGPEDVLAIPASVTLVVGDCEIAATVKSNGKDRLPRRTLAKQLAVGLVASEETGNVPAGSDPGGTAFRFRGSFETSDAFGRRPLAFSLRAAVDTTSEDSGEFLDDNSVALRLSGGALDGGSVIKILQLGLEATYARAFHSRDRTLDGTLTMDVRFPFLQAANLFATEPPFRAPPLSATLSYGYRDAREATEAGTTDLNGRVFKAQLAYHLFLLDHYRVSLGYDYAHTDPTGGDVLASRNQRMHRAAIAYLPAGGARFEAVASYEDGSSGPLLREVRQFFLGVALRRLGLDGQ